MIGPTDVQTAGDEFRMAREEFRRFVRELSAPGDAAVAFDDVTIVDHSCVLVSARTTLNCFLQRFPNFLDSRDNLESMIDESHLFQFDARRWSELKHLVRR